MVSKMQLDHLAKTDRTQDEPGDQDRRREGRWNHCRRNAPHELRQHNQAENPHILFGSEPVGANHDPGIEFAPDSPLEGDGFEPSVPLQIRSRFRDLSPVPLLTGSRPGTGSSNPSPSSKEAPANLISGATPCGDQAEAPRACESVAEPREASAGQPRRRAASPQKDRGHR